MKWNAFQWTNLIYSFRSLNQGVYTYFNLWGKLPGLLWMPCYSAHCKPKHHQTKHPPDSRIVSHYPLLMWLRLSADLTDLVKLTWHSIHLIPEDLRVCKPEKLNVRRVLQSHPKLRANLAKKKNYFLLRLLITRDLVNQRKAVGNTPPFWILSRFQGNRAKKLTILLAKRSLNFNKIVLRTSSN